MICLSKHVGIDILRLSIPASMNLSAANDDLTLRRGFQALSLSDNTKVHTFGEHMDDYSLYVFNGGGLIEQRFCQSRHAYRKGHWRKVLPQLSFNEGFPPPTGLRF